MVLRGLESDAEQYGVYRGTASIYRGTFPQLSVIPLQSVQKSREKPSTIERKNLVRSSSTLKSSSCRSFPFRPSRFVPYYRRRWRVVFDRSISTEFKRAFFLGVWSLETETPCTRALPSP